MASHNNIQLVIKAPNQNLEDHVVKCNLSWTVGELKEHLSEEYPTKPEVLEQRLIYSGHLLHNHLHLRDILRHDEEESNVHTLHLVCNASNTAFKPQKPSQTCINQPNVPSQETQSSQPAENSGQRSVPYVPFVNPTSLTAPSPVMPPLNVDSQVLAQMTAMQQMYIYYFNQYLQSLNTTAIPATNSQVFRDPTNAAPNVADIPAPQPPNLRVNGRGGQVGEENDELANRDWLDHLFQGGRYLLLFCVVFCYSTPERLMIVIICAVMAFLYHEGWFVRRTRLMPAPLLQRNQQQAPVDGLNNDNHLVNQGGNNEIPQDGHEIEAAMDGNDPPHAQNGHNNNNQFYPLTILTAFLSSLIPDPPPPVNAN